MATNQTQNYALNQWELSDSVIMADFNADNQKVDTALANLNQRIDTAVADAEQRLNAIIDQMRTTMPHVQIGSYVGTGTYGAANPNTLTFDFTPKMLFFVDTSNDTELATLRYTVFAMYPSTAGDWLSGYSDNVAYGRNRVTWGDKSISWYADFLYSDNSAGYQTSAGPSTQRNEAGTTYHYIAIG